MATRKANISEYAKPPKVVKSMILRLTPGAMVSVELPTVSGVEACRDEAMEEAGWDKAMEEAVREMTVLVLVSVSVSVRLWSKRSGDTSAGVQVVLAPGWVETASIENEGLITGLFAGLVAELVAGLVTSVRDTWDCDMDGTKLDFLGDLRGAK
jgi:hypothetical protein